MMPGAKTPSLIRRLIAWQALALLAAWLALGTLGTLIGWGLVARGEVEIKQRLDQFATLLQARLEAPGRADPVAGLAEAEQALRALGGFTDLGEDLRPQVQVWHEDGRLLYRSPGLGGARLDAEHWWLQSRSLPQQDLTLLVAEPRVLQPTALLPMLWVVLQSQLGVFLWHGLVIWITVRSGLKPLRQLAERISRRRAGDLAPVQVDKLYTETAPVVHELNALLAREGQRLEAERRFLADAAHELRTPLAAVNAQAHLLLGEQEPKAREEAAGALRAGIARVSHLLAQLLTLARAETTVQTLKPERLDAAALLRERIAQLAPLARQRGIQLELLASDHREALLERSGFCSVVDNLVDNAIRYSPGGARVEVRLDERPEGLALSVRDNGPGLAAAQRERVFERFYRVPGSTEQGTGLGLAIVKRIAEREGAMLNFVDGLDNRGLGLQLRYPTA